ncbi:MAG: hypothetical protein L3K23_02935 [Thermoplasmata archaeon]|nr:hypothetical protein [Thermoplasmata archaeon]
MVWDAVDGYVLAVTPNCTGPLRTATWGVSDITWKFSNGTWSVLATTGAPANALDPALVYDAHDQYALLFGGLRISGYSGTPTAYYMSNETWKYAGGVWTNLTGTVGAAPPPAGTAIEMTYDAADEYVLLYTSYDVNQTWSYAGGAWTNLTAVSPTTPPFGGAFGYDAADQYVVSFGGFANSWWFNNATWTFHAGVWTNRSANVTNAPPPRSGSGVTYDPTLGQLVIFGGSRSTGWLYDPNASVRYMNYTALNDTWSYSGGTWTNQSLTAPSNVTLWENPFVFDPSSGNLVLVEEVFNSTTTNVTPVTWLLGNSSWSFVAPVLGLTAVGADAGTPFTLEVRTVPQSGALEYSYAGLPPGCSSRSTPRLSCTTQQPGDYAVTVRVIDSVGVVVSLTRSILVDPRPTLASFVPSLPIAEVGRPVSLSADGVGGTGALTFAYAGLPTGCVATQSSTVNCVPTEAGTFPVIAQATDALGVEAVAATTLSVVPAPAVAAFTVSPPVVDVGQPVVVAALSAGGVGPFTYAYLGLPLGCASVDQLSFRCLPMAPGSYVVQIGVTDQLGGGTSGTAALTVHGDPTITGFSASSPQVTVGGSIDLAVQVSGGTAPFVYLYAGLPAGCGGGNGATLSCLAAVTGEYSVTVTAVDATGALAAAALTVTVAAAPSTTPPHPGSAPGQSSSGAAASWFGPGPVAFTLGLAIGLLAFAATALWARRRFQRIREGEAIVQDLERRAPGPGTRGAEGSLEVSGPPREL